MNGTLSASKLKFSYNGGFSLQVESLDLRPGEIHALIGPNGCGKSTLLRLMLGMIKPASGNVRLDDVEILSLPVQEVARRAAFLPQQTTPVFAARARDVVLLGRHPWNRGLGLPGEEDRLIACEAMQRMRVDALQDRFLDTLSGGERQRVMLASILAQQPRVILLDEPTSSLDIHHQVEVFQLLREEAKRGVGILVVTHDLTLAGHFADRITLMNAGRIVCTGKAAEVLREETLRPVYGVNVRVVTSPADGMVSVIPSVDRGRDGPPGRPLRNGAPGGRALPPAEKNSMSSWKSYALTIALFAAAGVVAVMLSPHFGAEKINFMQGVREMFSIPRGEWGVSAGILALRLPRVVLGLLAGIALGGAGAAFQSALRNPLAEPYTLGIASASSLGAVIALSCPAISFSIGFMNGTQVWAMGLALCGVLFLQIACRRGWGHSLTGLLLTGFTMGLVSAALIMLVRFLANPLTARAMDQWMVGGLEVSGWRDVTPCLPFWLIGVVLVLIHARELNQVEMGEEMARGRGVDAEKVRRRVLVGGSLATAAVVAVTGPIGFVGLLVPHMVRRIVGTDERLVVPCSMLAGAAVLVLADAAARSITLSGRGAELPVGILTSLIGGPVFLFLLLRRKS